MILREVQIENFRQITGTNCIKFARPDSEALTVILGENGSGKTTFLQACLWCLYDRRDFVNEEELASYRALAEAESGEDVPVRVRVKFNAEQRRYTAERKLNVRQATDGSLDVSEPEFHLSRTEPSGENVPCDDPEREVGRLLPEQLADFFFFQGEDLEDLVAESGADKLKSAVEEFIDLIVLDRGIRHLGQVEKDFEKRLEDQTSGRPKELSKEIREITEELDELDTKDEKAKEKKNKLLSQKEDVENKLRKFEEIQPLIDEKRELTEKIEMLDDSIESKEEELARTISRNGYLNIGRNALSAGSRLADEAVERGELPANIKPRFVDDLIEEGECICGRELGEYERGVLQEWKSSNELAALETSINALRSGVGNLERRLEEFEQDFEVHRDELADLRMKRKRAVARRSRIESKLEGDEHQEVDIKKLQRLLRNINEDLQDISFEAGQRDEARKDLEKRKEELIEKRDNELRKEQKARVTSRRAGAAVRVRKALEDIRSGWVGLVQQYLDKELKRNWKEMAQLERLVEFDRDFRLSIKERGADGSWVKSAPSSANQRALALGFVTSLIRLARDAGTSEEQDSMLFAGGDYPLVMDAPFATMDTEFKKQVPVGLQNIVPQLVLVNSLDQWEGTVQDVLGDSVGSVYVMELHGPEVESKTFEFEGREFDYTSCESDATYDWTVIREVT